MLGMLTGLAAGVAAGCAGCAAVRPTSQFFGPTLAYGSDPGQMAFTFDDGPNDPHTLHLLDLLNKYNAKATFFLIGKYVRKRPDIVRTIKQGGHAVGNHTYNHPNLLFTPLDRLQQELEDCNKALEDAVGAGDPLFRSPFACRRRRVLRAAHALGLAHVMWSVTAYDWNAKSSQAIITNVVRRVAASRRRRAEVILLHDGNYVGFGADRSFTVEAMRVLLEKYSAQGKQFVSIVELAV
jgi:peptidoglycan-N-acetylglucosamine deacetylase